MITQEQQRGEAGCCLSVSRHPQGPVGGEGGLDGELPGYAVCSRGSPVGLEHPAAEGLQLRRSQASPRVLLLTQRGEGGPSLGEESISWDSWTRGFPTGPPKTNVFSPVPSGCLSSSV